MTFSAQPGIISALASNVIAKIQQFFGKEEFALPDMAGVPSSSCSSCSDSAQQGAGSSAGSPGCGAGGSGKERALQENDCVSGASCAPASSSSPSDYRSLAERALSKTPRGLASGQEMSGDASKTCSMGACLG